MGTPDAPRKTADLYAMDGVLWGTVSEEVRDTPEEIYDYFVSVFFFFRLNSKGSCKEVLQLRYTGKQSTNMILGFFRPFWLMRTETGVVAHERGADKFIHRELEP